MERARKIIANYADKGVKIGVAVSGGVDSMVLLDLTLKCPNINHQNIVILNVEHGIRGQTSVNDSEFVKSYAQKNDIKIIATAVKVKELSTLSGNSYETEARIVRHKFFSEVIERKEVDVIFIAHNLGDQTESVMMHILRGSGTQGLIGMSEQDGYYVRPLLSVSRQKIENYAKENEILYCQDESNFDQKYMRNFLRNSVLPLIRERLDIDGAIATLSQTAREDNAYLVSQAQATGLVTTENDGVSISLTANAQHSAICTRLIFMALEKMGKRQDITQKHIVAIKNLFQAQNGKRINLPNGVIARKEYDKILFYLYSSQEDSETIPYEIGYTAFMQGIISVLPTAEVPQKGRLIFDGDKVDESCIIRTRREGDKFMPYGGKRKKLKEYLIDKKIPARIRNTIPLLCRNDEVLAIVGIEVSDNIKVTKETVNKTEIKFLEESK